MIFPTCSIRSLLALLVLAVSGCGEVVVVQDDSSSSGAGGSVAGSGGSSAGGSDAGGAFTGGSGGTNIAVGGSGGTTECEALEAEMLTALDLATTCDPSIDVAQCSGTAIAKTYCNCAVVANDFMPDEAAASFALGDLWYLNCEYNFCESGCYPTDAPWYCDSVTNRCQPAYE